MWGAMRGAVTLALALGVTENRAIEPEIQRFVAILATGFVLFTLLVNGTTLRPVMRLMQLDRLSPIDQALRHQVLALALTRVRDAIRAMVADYHIGAQPAAEVHRPVRGAHRRGDRPWHLRCRDRRPRPHHARGVRARHPGARADPRAFPPSRGVAPDRRAPAGRRRGDHRRRPHRRPARLQPGGQAPAGVRPDVPARASAAPLRADRSAAGGEPRRPFRAAAGQPHGARGAGALRRPADGAAARPAGQRAARRGRRPAPERDRPGPGCAAPAVPRLCRRAGAALSAPVGAAAGGGRVSEPA